MTLGASSTGSSPLCKLSTLLLFLSVPVHSASSSVASDVGSKSRLLVDGGVLTEADKQELLELHNMQRSITALGDTGSQPPAKDMVELVWDEDIASGAKAWADNCNFAHDDSGYGENLYTSYSSGDNLDNIQSLLTGVGKWYDEHVDYNYDSGSCGDVCGHYTQNVWAKSTKLGCGYAECENIPGWYQVILVCRYDPRGNYIGEKPYEEAGDVSEIASNCPADYVGDSESGLCVTSASPPSGPPPPSCSDSPLDLVSPAGTVGCDVIAANPDYCELGANSHCPMTCNACETYGCVDTNFKFNIRTFSIFCSVLDTVDQETFDRACGIEDIRETCRGTCGLCD